MPLAHSPAHLDIDIGAGDGPITCNTEHLHSKPRTDTHERSHLDPGTKREPIPVPIPTSAFHAGPPLLSPTPTRSSSMDAALPPAYTPLALGLERPNAPVGGLSSCSPWSPPHRTPVEGHPGEIHPPATARAIFIPSPVHAQSRVLGQVKRGEWRPAKLEVASLSPDARGITSTGRYVHGTGSRTPRTAGIMTHTRWASLPCAMPAVVPMTGGLEPVRPRSPVLMLGRTDHSHPPRSLHHLHQPEGPSLRPHEQVAQPSGSVRIPSFDDPRERFHGRSFTSALPITLPSLPISSRGGAAAGGAMFGGHKRSLSEELKRLIIPTLPIRRDRESGRDGGVGGVNENVARSAAFSPPSTTQVAKVAGLRRVAGEKPGADNGDDHSDATGGLKGEAVAVADPRARSKISTEHLHLQVDVRAPQRPYRSPGTASFMVRRDEWAFRGGLTGDAGAGAHQGAPSALSARSASAEAKAFVADQEARKRESDEAVWEYEAAVRGLEYQEYREYQAGYGKRGSGGTFGERDGVLVPHMRVECADTDVSNTEATQSTESGVSEVDSCRTASKSEVNGNEWDVSVIERTKQGSEPGSDESSERSFGTSPVGVDADIVLLY